MKQRQRELRDILQVLSICKKTFTIITWRTHEKNVYGQQGEESAERNIIIKYE